MGDTVALAYVHDNELAYSFHASLQELIGHDLANRQRVIRGGFVAMRYGTGGIVEARNKATKDFLDRSQADWLFWIDTDMGFDPDTVDRLMAVADPTERPIVGGLCFAQKESEPDGMSGWICRPTPTIYDWVSRVDGKSGFTPRYRYDRDTLVRCAGTGSACVLIHRSVLQRIRDAEGDVWYDRLINPSTGQLIAEDLSLCARAAKLDIPVHIHTGVKTTHLKNVWVGERQYLEASWPDPATDPVAVVVPAMQRPDNAAPFMASLRATTGLATAYFVCDADDEAQIDAAEAAGATVIVNDGKSRSFPSKANLAFGQTTEPWVLLVGDDVVFRPGWYDRAVRAAGDRFHLVATNDLGNPRVTAGTHATHPLIRRTWVEQHGASWDGPGSLCHDGYRHLFVDDEWTTVARQAGVFVAAPDAVIEHLHPAWGKATDDDVYKRGRMYEDSDARLFRRRLRANLLEAAA